MQTQPPEEWLSLAEIRRAEAQRLVAAGRYRDALRVVNSAIQMAPSHAPLFHIRARIFDELGMERQADGDRREAERLGMPMPPRPAAPAEPETPPAPAPATEQGAPAAPVLPGAAAAGAMATESAVEGVAPSDAPVAPAPVPGARPRKPPPLVRAPRGRETPRPEGAEEPREGGGLPRALGTVVIALIVLGVAGAGVVLAALSLLGKEDVVPGISKTEPTVTRAASPRSTALPVANVKGTPYDLDRVQKAWDAAGLTLAKAQPSGRFSGFSAAPAFLDISRGGDSARVAVFVYPDGKSAASEWNLTEGSAPSPQADRDSSAQVGWWNRNTVVMLLTARNAVAESARDAFLALSP